MTTRLPVPGSDDGTWGDILNSFLEVSHNSDGTLAANTVGYSQLQSGTIANAGGVTSVNGFTPSSGAVVLDAQVLGSGTPAASTFLNGNLKWSVPQVAYAQSSLPVAVAATGANINLIEVSLAAGVWLIYSSVAINNSNNGASAYVWIGPTSNSDASAYQETYLNIAGYTGASNVLFSNSYIVTLPSAVTVYLGWNGPSSLTAQPGINSTSLVAVQLAGN